MEFETYGDVIDAFERGVGVEPGDTLTDYIRKNNIKIKEITMDPLGDLKKIIDAKDGGSVGIEVLFKKRKDFASGGWHPGVGRDKKGYQTTSRHHSGGGGGGPPSVTNPYVPPVVKKPPVQVSDSDVHPMYQNWIRPAAAVKTDFLKKQGWYNNPLKFDINNLTLYGLGSSDPALADLYKGLGNPDLTIGGLLEGMAGGKYDKLPTKITDKVQEHVLGNIDFGDTFQKNWSTDVVDPTFKNNRLDIDETKLEVDEMSVKPKDVLSIGVKDGGRVGFQAGGSGNWWDGLTGEAKGIYDSMTAYGASDAEIQSKLQAQNLWSPDGTTTDSEQVTGIINQDIGGGGGGMGELDLTFREGAVPRGPTTDFNINPAAQLTGKGRIDPMGGTYDNLAMMGPMDYKTAGYHMSEIPGQEGYQAPSKYFQEPSLIDKGIGSIKDFFSGLGTQRVRGTLGDRLSKQPRLPLPAAMASWSLSPFNTQSRNYNENFVDQLNFLESSGAPGGYIGRDEGSGLLKYGPASVLAGQNVISMFGTNDYEEQLEKKRDWFNKRIQANKSYNKKKYQQTLDEIKAWQNSPDNPKNNHKPAGPAHTILGPDNPLIGKIDHTGAGSGHGSITRAPGSKGPKGTPTHRTRDDLMASGGRVGLATMFTRRR